MLSFSTGMKDTVSNVVDAPSLLTISKSSKYISLLNELNQLSSVDLDALRSDGERICFFANILNVMLCHAAITEVVSCSISTRTCLSENAGLRDLSWEKALPRFEFSYCRTAYLKKYGCHIGKLGFVR